MRVGCQTPSRTRDPHHVTALTPLRLALDPQLPTRTPGFNGTFEHGFRLRIPDGPVILSDDPLLTLYGARIATVIANESEEALQADTFDPGSCVQLVAEGDGDVGVWDTEGLRRGGELPGDHRDRHYAAHDHGLEQCALVLIEERMADEDRRQSIDLLIFHPAFVHVDRSAADRYLRPPGKARRRLVLVADGGGDVRWWDPAVESGPRDADDLPMSDELAGAMRRLRDGYAELHDNEESDPHGFERFEAELERDALDRQAAALWRRARAELGRRYAVGFLASGMEQPVWKPSELEEDASDDFGDIPF